MWVALPLAAERTQAPVTHCHSAPSVPSRHVHARVAVSPALPLAPERTRTPVSHCHSAPSVPPRHVHARVAVSPALPLAAERTQAPVTHCHSAPSVPSRHVHARVAVWVALPLAPERARTPSLHCQMVPCNAVSEGRRKEGARAGRIMNMLWLFSFSQSTCHKALPCISACDFCLWRDGRDAAQSYGVSGFCLLEAARSQWLLA